MMLEFCTCRSFDEKYRRQVLVGSVPLELTCSPSLFAALRSEDLADAVHFLSNLGSPVSGMGERRWEE